MVFHLRWIRLWRKGSRLLKVFKKLFEK